MKAIVFLPVYKFYKSWAIFIRKIKNISRNDQILCTQICDSETRIVAFSVNKKLNKIEILSHTQVMIRAIKNHENLVSKQYGIASGAFAYIIPVRIITPLFPIPKKLFHDHDGMQNLNLVCIEKFAPAASKLAKGINHCC